MAGIYIHVPFCKTRCRYCDFYSTTDEASMERYVDAVVREARMHQNELNGLDIITLYVGGGTPSQLPATLLSRLVNGLTSCFDLSRLEEATIEVNPDDIADTDVASAIHDIGFNRVSMGVQSMVDDELRLIGRRHDAEAVTLAVDNLRNAGFRNISLDLIYGLPTQTVDSWKYSLQALLKLKPQHISAYNLSYEPGTVLSQWLEQKRIQPIDEELCNEMYDILVDSLVAAGFQHYEISNFALQGYHSRHNSSYWIQAPYIGLGAAAHSYDGNRIRSCNPSSISEYVSAIEQDTLPLSEEHLNDEQLLTEAVMLGMRTARGVDLEAIAIRFGKETLQRLLANAQPYIDDLHLIINNNHISLNRSAIFISDTIIVDLLHNL